MQPLIIPADHIPLPSDNAVYSAVAFGIISEKQTVFNAFVSQAAMQFPQRTHSGEFGTRAGSSLI